MKKYSIITNIVDDLLVTELSTRKEIPTFCIHNPDVIYLLCGHTKHFAMLNFDPLNLKQDIFIYLVMQISEMELQKFNDDDSSDIDAAVFELQTDMEYAIETIKRKINSLRPDLKFGWMLLNTNTKTLTKQ